VHLEEQGHAVLRRDANTGSHAAVELQLVAEHGNLVPAHLDIAREGYHRDLAPQDARRQVLLEVSNSVAEQL
jgi:hypothetical protein